MFSYKTLRKARANGSRALFAALWLFVVFAAGCRYDMQDQPKYIALRESTFFKDGVSARPLEKGTIPRGFLRDDTYFWTGKISANAARNGQGGGTTNERGDAVSNEAGSATQSGTSSSASQNTGGAAAGASGQTGETDGDMFPYPVTPQMVNRGQERFQVFCSMCHGQTGYGDGMIVRRGFKRPPSYHTDDLRAKPVGHYFDAITNGWGSMPSYAEQIPPDDRWAIISYIRALQLSQQGVAATNTSNAPVGGGQGARQPTPVRGQQ
ncbi:MAG: cytochrome c [Pyrinomonadaceae bacterium]